MAKKPHKQNPTSAGRQWNPESPFEIKLKEHFGKKSVLIQFLGVTAPRLDRMLDNLQSFLFYIPILSEEMKLSPNEITESITGKKYFSN